MQPSGYTRVMQVRALTLMPIVALICSASAPACLAEPHTLNWPAKAQTIALATGNTPQYMPPQAMAASTPALPQGYSAAPPSPYGNVGDPFVRRLNWQAKQAQTPLPQAQAPAPMLVTYTAPVEPTRRHSVIMPALVPAPALPLDMPPPPAAAPVETPRHTAPEPAKAPVAAPAPKPAQAPVVSSEPVREGAYQIPQTSKYYRGTRSDNALPPAVTAPATPAPKAEATNPADQAFVPGEPITDARTQSPRLYSLHRQYGLTPDAISSVSDNAPAPQSEASASPPASTKP